MRILPKTKNKKLQVSSFAKITSLSDAQGDKF